MKFDESSLTAYLVKHLEALTDADPGILAEYVVALLKKDKPVKELHKLCADNLVDFLGHSAKSFAAELFQALEDGLVGRSNDNLNSSKKPDPPQSAVVSNTVQPKASSQKEDSPSSSEHRSDSKDEEISDDDDDRNHKHRRRDVRPNSSDNNDQEQFIRRPRKRSKPYDNGEFPGPGHHLNATQKEYNPTSERDASSKFEKRRIGFTPMARAPWNDPGPRFDLSTSICRPPILGRGRGRSTVPWSHNEPRFHPTDMHDFASQMGPLGSRHPSHFMGPGLPGAPSTQSAPWGAYGFIPGVPNRVLEPMLPLNLQGPFQPSINPSLNLGIPRQRCRDFEEQGFCLRGDTCPMEHGLNRIVVEDVQSLSQFNLPVSIPNSHTVGMPSGSGSLQASAPSSLLISSKAIPSKICKVGMTDDTVKLNGASSMPGGGDADVYDPDQPLWNNGRPEVPGELSSLPSPKPSLDADTASHESFRLSDDMESEQLSRTVNPNIGSQSTNASVWGRVRSGSKLDKGSKISNSVLRKEAQEDHRAPYQGKDIILEEPPSKFTANKSLPRPWTDLGHSGGRAHAKATRTLFVNGIPQHSNRKEALLAHFQKFGLILDIYIPVNSEKAFVQFSKREDAEAALKSPDAVMGNRFIKLWWANRDRIQDGGQFSGPFKSSQSSGVEVGTAPSQLLASERGKESMLSATQKETTARADETRLLVTGASRNPLTNCPKPAPPQKKLENLELLKEELRKKQALLDQKRDDFRRQLTKFEKQATTSKKVEAVSEQAVKRHKGEMIEESVKATSLKSTSLCTIGECQEAEIALEKGSSGEVLVSSSSQIRSTIEQPTRNINQTSRPPATLQNRFKLDNRPASFRILSPLPADLANVAALKEHFSLFGDLASVLLEEPETLGHDAGQGSPQCCSACVTYNTRHSAEKAYLNGKCWQGHNLLFTWLKVPPISSTSCGIQSIPPTSTLTGDSNTEAYTEQPISGTLSMGGGKSTSSVEGSNHAPTTALDTSVQATVSSPTAADSKSTIKSEVSVTEDNTANGYPE